MSTRRSRLRTIAVASGATLVLTLAACSSSSSPSSGGGSGSAAQGNSTVPATPAGSAGSVQQLAAAAEQEGSLTWYTANPEKDIAQIVADFNKVYPDIKVNSLRLSADKLPARVMTEQRAHKYNADVVQGDVAYVNQLIAADAVQPYTPPDAQPLPKGIDVPDGYANVNFVHTTVIAYNPKVLAQKGLPAPTSFADFTKPAWKGNFSVNPGAANWYLSMVGALGHDKAERLATAMGANSPRLVESHTQAVTQVQSGEPVATAMAYGWSAASFKEKTPDTVDFVHPKTFPASIDLIELAKNAPHPNAARLFIDWIMSKQGQQDIVDIMKHVSLRTDVRNDPTVWNPSKWSPAWAEPNLPAAKYNAYVKELQTAFKAP